MEVAEPLTESEEEESEPLLTCEEVAKLSASLSKPQPTREGWSAASVVDGAVETRATTNPAALKEEFANADAKLALGKGAAALGVNLKVTAARKEELLKTIAKAERVAPTPSANVSAHQLRLDRSKYEEKYGKDKQRQQTGAANARECLAALQTAQTKLMD